MRILEVHFLLAAVVLHLAIPVAAAIAPDSQLRGLAVSTGRAAAEIDVDVDGLELPLSDQAIDSALPIGEARPLAHRERWRQPSSYHPAPYDTSDPLTEPPPSSEGATQLFDSPEGAGNDDYYRPPSRADVDGIRGIPGLDGRSAWQYPGGVPPDDGGSRAAPTRTPRRTYNPDRATEVLESGVRAKDERLSLHFPGGPAIKDALVASVRDSDAPYVSGGSFSVNVDAQGRVSKITLLGFTGGGSATWQGIRKSAQARLAGRTLPLKSSFSKGAIVSVAVRSDQKMPGGGTSREGTTLSFDVTDIAARPVRVVTGNWHATPIK